MIITHSFVVGGKGYKTGVTTQGKEWQAQSFKASPFEEYVSTFLPPFVHEGMTVTVSGTVKKEVKGEYTNYSIQYPVIDTVYQPKTPEQQETSSAGMWTPGGGALPDTSDNIGYYGSSPTEISDSDLPF